MKKFVIVLMALALLAGTAMAEKPALEKPVQAAPSMRADFTHFEGGDTCIDEAEYNIIAPDGLSYEGDLQANAEIDWFEVFVVADGTYVFETTPGTASPTDDTRLYLYDGECLGDVALMNQIAYNDDGGDGYFSLIEIDLTAGTYYAAVTLYPYSTPHPGSFTLTMTGATPPPPPPANDTCEGALPLPFGGSFTFDMCGALNDYDLADADDSCTGYGTAGLDVVYYVDLVENQELTVECQTDYDIAIYLLSDCADMNSCVIGADGTVSAGYETFVFDAGTAPGRYYLILDGYSSAGYCGEWTVTVGEDAVATEDASFGALKAMYR